MERAPASEGRRWYLRINGEEKDVYNVWFTLRQRTLHYETYVMPAPEENHGRLYEHLLRRNQGFNGLAFVIGIGMPCSSGLAPVHAVDDDELTDPGVVLRLRKQCFRPAMCIGRVRFPS